MRFERNLPTTQELAAHAACRHGMVFVYDPLDRQIAIFPA